MADLMRVPEVAAGATDVVLAQWLVAEGASFAAGAALAVIETDKAQVEVEADSAAVLLRALVPEGAEVPVGAPMALVGEESEIGSDLDATLAALGVDEKSDHPQSSRRDVPDQPTSQNTPAPAPARKSPDVPEVPANSHTPAQDADRGSGGDSKRRFASPLARRLLREAGVDEAEVLGSGPGGRIVRRDAAEAIARAAEQPSRDASDAPADGTSTNAERSSTADHVATPHSRLRKAVATRLSASKREVPHFYLKRTVEVDALLQLRSEVNGSADTKISVNDFLLKAVAAAYRAVSDANVIWTDEEMLSFESVDVSVAVASDRGLVTPVVRGIDNRSVGSISREVKRLAAAANEGKLKQHELEGGTISVTNLGMFGVDEFAAIINPPQSLILAVGAVRPAAVARDGEVAIAQTLSLVLSVDHRAIDGALAARWLDAYVTALSAPMGLLL